MLAGIKDIEQNNVIPNEQVLKNAKKRLEQSLK